MKRTISSAQTFIAKFIAPILFIIVLISLLSDFYKSPKNLISLPFPFLIFIFLCIAFSFWFSGKMKKVSIDGQNLYISNYLKEISVPLSDIYDVTEIVWLNGHPVTIHLKNPTELGSKILFMPKIRMFAFFSSHPVVSELKESARSSRNKY